jgi:hypothetical protein
VTDTDLKRHSGDTTFFRKTFRDLIEFRFCLRMKIPGSPIGIDTVDPHLNQGFNLGSYTPEIK